MDKRGQVVWRDRLVWIGQPGIRRDAATPLPLVLYPPPSITRALALTALERAGRTWRVACISGSLSGIYAATRAGLGVAPHSGMLVPSGLTSIAPSKHLPELSEIEFVVIGPKTRDKVAEAVIDAILQSRPAREKSPFASSV